LIILLLQAVEVVVAVTLEVQVVVEVLAVCDAQ